MLRPSNPLLMFFRNCNDDYDDGGVIEGNDRERKRKEEEDNLHKI